MLASFVCNFSVDEYVLMVGQESNTIVIHSGRSQSAVERLCLSQSELRLLVAKRVNMSLPGEARLC